MISGWKRIHKPRRTLSGFLRIFMELCRSKVQLVPPHGNLISGVSIPEIAYMLLRFQILCIDWFFLKKKRLLWQKTYRILMKLTWVGSNHLKVFWWMLWAISFSGVDAFLPIWILFALDFYCYILKQEFLDECIRISTYQTEQTYVKP